MNKLKRINKRINMRVVIGLALSALMFITIVHFAQGQTIPAQYALKLDVSSSNTTNNNVDALVPFSIDSSLLSAGNLVRADYLDIIFADDMDVLTNGFIQDISSSTSTWWIVSKIPANSSSTERLYLSGPAAQHDFPVHANNFTFLSANSTTSLEIIDDLDVQITVETTTCGPIVSKVNLETEADAKGYGIFFVGNEDFVVSTSSTAPTSLNKFTYYDITPLQNFWLCGVSIGAPSFPEDYERVRVVNRITNIVALDTVPIYFPNVDGSGIATVISLRDTTLLTTGNTYRVYLDSSTIQPVQTFFGGGFPGHMSSTGTVAAFGQPDVSDSFDGETYKPMLWSIDDTFSVPFVALPGVMWLAEDITSSTSTVSDITNSGRLESVINCHSLKSLGASTLWDGTRLDIQLEYDDDTGDMTTTYNGFPFTFSLPTCQTFGNKSGVFNSTTPTVTDFLNTGTTDRMAATLFTAPVSGDLETINVKMTWDRNGDGRNNVGMEVTMRVALFDSSRNLIASPAAKQVSLPDSVDSTAFQESFTFILGIPVTAATDYYLGVWAGDMIQSSPVLNRDVGNEELLVSFLDETNGEANQLIFCPIDIDEDITASAERLAVYESITVYVTTIFSGTPIIKAALYDFNVGSQRWDLIAETDAIMAAVGFNELDFTTVATHDFSINNDQAIVVWSDEPVGTQEIGYGINRDPFEAGVDLDFIPIRTEGMWTCVDRAQGATYPTFPDPVTVSGGALALNPPLPVSFEQQVFMFLTMSDFIDVDLRPAFQGDGSFDIVFDNEDYDGLWPDPFTLNSTSTNLKMTIWGDVIPSTFDSIGTSNDDLVIGGGLTGFIDDISISSSSTLVLFVPFLPSNNSETQAGDVSNSFTWLGTIQDGSGANNDLTYRIIADNAAIVSTLIPLGASAVALSLPVRTVPNIFGNPDVSSALIPEPTIASPITDKLRNAFANGDAPASFFWLVVTAFILSIISAHFMKFWNNDTVPWITGIVGIFIVSQIAGPELLIVWVILQSLWATGLWGIFNFAR